MTEWNKRFMGLARHVASWSKDASTRVGSVIVDDRRRIVSLGYNGFPRGVADDEYRLAVRSEKYQRIVHAEINSLLNASKSVDGCRLFVWPLPPCNECAKAIINAGISEVYYLKQDIPDRWSDSSKIAFEMFKEAGVKTFEIELEN